MICFWMMMMMMIFFIGWVDLVGYYGYGLYGFLLLICCLDVGLLWYLVINIVLGLLVFVLELVYGGLLLIILVKSSDDGIGRYVYV